MALWGLDRPLLLLLNLLLLLLLLLELLRLLLLLLLELLRLLLLLLLHSCARCLLALLSLLQLQLPSRHSCRFNIISRVIWLNARNPMLALAAAAAAAICCCWVCRCFTRPLGWLLQLNFLSRLKQVLQPQQKTQPAASFL
jgi:hypothetical protein